MNYSAVVLFTLTLVMSSVFAAYAFTHPFTVEQCEKATDGKNGPFN